MIYQRRFENWPVTMLLMVTIGMATAWVFEPAAVASSWLLRLGLASGCLLAAATTFCLEMMRQTRDARKARQYVESLCLDDFHDLAQASETVSLPSISQRSGWMPLFVRLRDYLTECGQRFEETERAWTGAEVRMRRLANDHAQLQNILEHLVNPVVAINQYDELILANLAARRLLGTTVDESSRRPVEDQIDSPPLVGQLTDTRKRKSPAARVSELEVTDREGTPRWFRASCRALSIGDGEANEEHGAVAVLTDTSNEKEIQQRHAEFVSAASHEMKTPLAGIRAYVELLLDEEAEDPETREEFLEVISTQAERLQRLIENLLNLARIEAGVVSVDKQTQSLNDLLEKAFSVVLPSAEQKEIDLVQDLSPMYLGVLADRDMIMQSAINLLSNAIKYTHQGGRVALRSRTEDNAAVFEVEDTGVGLTKEDAQNVFKKFYRVKKDQQMAGGTGLGLPLAKHIVEDVHGGELSVNSELGKGSVFRVSLPVIRTKK